MTKRWALVERVDVPDSNNPSELFMVRWRVVQTPWCGLYVHRIDKPDPRETLHDHPWPFTSLVLRGGYQERFGLREKGRFGIRLGGRRRGPITDVMWRMHRWGSVHWMRKTDVHAIVSLRRSPTWTLVLVGRRRPEPSWGYVEGSEWIPHDQHRHAAELDAALAARQHQDAQ